MRFKYGRPLVALFVALAALLFFAPSAQAQERSLVAALNGDAAGDQDGSGYVWLELNQGQGTICYEMAVRNTGPVASLRLVELAGGRSVALLLNDVGTTSDCVTVDKQIIRQVRRNFAAYGVVVGTSQYPQGALSGALALPSAELLQLPGQAPVAQAGQGDVDWGAVDWASIDLAAVDWAQVQWEEIDWAAIDWDTVDLRDFDLDAIDWGAIDLAAIDWDEVDLDALRDQDLDWLRDQFLAGHLGRNWNRRGN